MAKETLMKCMLHAKLFLFLALLPVAVAAQQADPPIFTAIRQNHVALVKSVLAAGAAINATDRDGSSALHIAVAGGNPAIVAELLRHGADPNAANSEGTTPLMNAAAGGQILSLGAYSRRSVGFYNSPTHQLVLARGGVWDAAPWMKAPPLPPADRKVLQLLIAHGALVDARTEEGKTALWWAVRTGQVGTMRALLAHHANPNISDQEVGSPLQVATVMHRSDLARTLLARHADPTMRGGNGQLPIVSAAFDGDTLLVTLLAKHKADLNPMVLQDKKPLLSILLERHSGAMVQLLLSLRADPNRKDGDGVRNRR
jgi:ankyrin repeat protein